MQVGVSWEIFARAGWLAGSASGDGARNTMRSRNDCLSAARTSASAPVPCPVTTISAARRRRSSALSSDRWL